MSFTTKELLIIRTVFGHVAGNSSDVLTIYNKLKDMLEGKHGVKHTCTDLRGDIVVNEPDVEEIVSEYAEACAKHAEAETLRERIAKFKDEFEGKV